MAARASRRPPLATLARRWLAVVLVAVIGYAYYHPMGADRTRHELSARSAEVDRLANEKRALQDRLQFSASSDALTREARRLGYIRPGEHLFIVKGIQAWKKAHTTIDGDGK
jgi:cell division protein FtsB